MQSRLALIVFLATSTVAVAAAADDTCPFANDSDDQAVFAAAGPFAGPWENLAGWNDLVSSYYVTDGSWAPWNWPISLDLTHPATKMSNGLMLVGEGPFDTWIGWHPASQYMGDAMPLGSPYHNDLTWYYDDSQAMSWEAQTATNFFQSQSTYRCKMFKSGDLTNTATERAAVMVHEAWHGWQYAHEWDTAHRDDCPAGTASCDWYYPHTQADFLPGDLYTSGDLNWAAPGQYVAGRFHSPYQMAMEYECDLSQFAQPWVPLPVVGAQGTARFFSNFRHDNNFSNAVSWRCGDPLPFD